MPWSKARQSSSLVGVDRHGELSTTKRWLTIVPNGGLTDVLPTIAPACCLGISLGAGNFPFSEVVFDCHVRGFMANRETSGIGGLRGWLKVIRP